MKWWFERERVTNAQILSLCSLITTHVQAIEQKMAILQNTVDSLLKVYKCIICGNQFARLPMQSDKRCPACQRDIKETAASSMAQGNGGHRGAGHNTRGIHKKVGPR
jgi:predicted Zn-ribbon and HTH transcriptional regulator